MSVRRAVAEDVPVIAELLQQLSYSVPESKLLQFLHNRPLYNMCIYEHEGAVVGFVSWYVTQYLLMNYERVHMEALVVHEAHRQRGVGKALLEAVECSGTLPRIVELLTGAHRIATGTHDFYKRLGYSDTAEHGKVYFRKILY